jgi:Tfp pilus assembly protein PilF
VVGVILSIKASRWIWSRLHGEETGGSRFWTAYGWAIGIVVTALIGATVMRNRDWRDEATLWGDVIRKDPTNSRAYMGLGVESLRQGDYGTALEMVEKAVQFGPASAQAHALRGYLKAQHNENTDALSDFATAIQLDSRAPYAFFYRGELNRKIGETDKALADYQAALTRLPFYSDAYLGMAMAYLDKEEIGKATEACARLVEIDPDDRRGYDCLGTLLMEQKRFSEAVRLYQKAVNRITQDGDIWYGLGVAYENSGMYKEAGDAFERAGRLMSDNRQAPQTIPRFD